MEDLQNILQRHRRKGFTFLKVSKVSISPHLSCGAHILSSRGTSLAPANSSSMRWLHLCVLIFFFFFLLCLVSFVLFQCKAEHKSTASGSWQIWRILVADSCSSSLFPPFQRLIDLVSVALARAAITTTNDSNNPHSSLTVLGGWDQGACTGRDGERPSSCSVEANFPSCSPVAERAELWSLHPSQGHKSHPRGSMPMTSANLITSQRPCLQLPSYWGLGIQ